MSLVTGEIIEVVRRGPPGGWSKGLRGAFPTDYVEFLPQPPMSSSSAIPTKAAVSSSVDLLSLSSVSTSDKFDAFSSIQSSPITGSASNLPPVETLTPLSAAKPSAMLPNTKSLIPDIVSSESDLLGMSSVPIASTFSTSAISTNSKMGNTTKAGVSWDLPPPDELTPVAVSNAAPAPAPVPSPAPAPAPAPTPAVAQVAQPATAGPVTTSRPLGWKPPPPTEAKQPVAYGGAKPESIATTQPADTSTANAQPKPASKPKIFAVVRYNRDAQGPTELSIKAGEVVSVSKQDSEWWYGATLDKRTGFFPGNYVQIRDDIDPAHPEAFVNKELGKIVQSPVAAPAQPPAKTVKPKPAVLRPSPAGIKLPRKGAKKKVFAELAGTTFALEPMEKGGSPEPVWYQSFFLDLFADEYKSKIVGANDSTPKTPAIGRMKHAFYVVLTALQRIDPNEQEGEGVPEVLKYTLKLLDEGVQNCARIPAGTKDATRFFTFLATFMGRVRGLSESDSVVIPTSWACEDGTEHAVLLLVTRLSEDNDCDFSVTVINTAEGADRGLDYHASNIDQASGLVLRNIAMELTSIPNDKICNTAFWCVHPIPTHDICDMYVRYIFFCCYS